MNLNQLKNIDISKLTLEQADKLSIDLGNVVRKLCDKAIDESNKLLNLYGMEAKMSVHIGPIGKVLESLEKSQNTKSKKPNKTRKSKS